MVHDSTFRYNFWTFPTYPPPCSRFLINSTYYTFCPPPCHPILCRCTHLSRTLFKVWRQMYPTRISMQRQTCRCTQLPSNIEQCGGEVGTSRQYGLKGGRAECIICRIYQKPWTRWGRCGHIETVWAERGAGRRYNMSNLSKTLNKVGEDVSTSRQYGLKWGRAEVIICRIYQKTFNKIGGRWYIETLWAERGAGRRSNL